MTKKKTKSDENDNLLTRIRQLEEWVGVERDHAATLLSHNTNARALLVQVLEYLLAAPHAKIARENMISAVESAIRRLDGTGEET